MPLTPEKKRLRNREKARRHYWAYRAEHSAYNRQYREQHKDKLSEQHRDYYQKHREEIRAKQRPDTEEKLIKKREYERQYRAAHRAALLENGRKSYQKNRSAILVRRNDKKLATMESAARRPKPDSCEVCGGTYKISFDHCHQRNIFRGWICHACNVILGMAEDDPERLRKLISYLEQISS